MKVIWHQGNVWLTENGCIFTRDPRGADEAGYRERIRAVNDWIAEQMNLHGIVDSPEERAES